MSITRDELDRRLEKSFNDLTRRGHDVRSVFATAFARIRSLSDQVIAALDHAERHGAKARVFGYAGGASIVVTYAPDDAGVPLVLAGFGRTEDSKTYMLFAWPDPAKQAP